MYIKTDSRDMKNRNFCHLERSKESNTIIIDLVCYGEV